MDYFAVIFKNPGEDHIRIPHRFVEMWGRSLNNPLTMKTWFGNESIVQYKKVDSTLWLDRGWSSFAREYEPQHKEVIFFQYTGDSSFVVTFFKPSGLETLTPLHPSIRFPAQFFKPFMKNEYFHRIKLNNSFVNMFGQQLSNPLTIYCVNGDAIEVEFSYEGIEMWLEKGWKHICENCGIQMDDFLFSNTLEDHGLNLLLLKNKENPPICTRATILDDVEPVVFHERTLWFTKITKSVKGGTQPLNIPAHIVREWFNGKPSNIDVMLPDGDKESSALLWYEPVGNKERRPNQCLFGYGWYEFAKKTDLPIGQHIRFFHKSNEAFFRVNITVGGV